MCVGRYLSPWDQGPFVGPRRGHPGSVLPSPLERGMGSGQACVSAGFTPGSTCEPPREDRRSQRSTVPFFLLGIKLSFH